MTAITYMAARRTFGHDKKPWPWQVTGAYNSDFSSRFEPTQIGVSVPEGVQAGLLP